MTENARFCPKCGAKAIPGTSFCGKCGAKLYLGKPENKKSDNDKKMPSAEKGKSVYKEKTKDTKRKRSPALLIIIIVLAAGIGFGIWKYVESGHKIELSAGNAESANLQTAENSSGPVMEEKSPDQIQKTDYRTMLDVLSIYKAKLNKLATEYPPDGKVKFDWIYINNDEYPELAIDKRAVNEGVQIISVIDKAIDAYDLKGNGTFYIIPKSGRVMMNHSETASGITDEVVELTDDGFHKAADGTISADKKQFLFNGKKLKGQNEYDQKMKSEFDIEKAVQTVPVFVTADLLFKKVLRKCQDCYLEQVSADTNFRIEDYIWLAHNEFNSERGGYRYTLYTFDSDKTMTGFILSDRNLEYIENSLIYENMGLPDLNITGAYDQADYKLNNDLIVIPRSTAMNEWEDTYRIFRMDQMPNYFASYLNAVDLQYVGRNIIAAVVCDEKSGKQYFLKNGTYMIPVARKDNFNIDTSNSMQTEVKRSIYLKYGTFTTKEEHSVKSENATNIFAGEYYSVLDEYDDGTDHWYKVGDHQWLPGNDKTIEVFENDETSSRPWFVFEKASYTINKGETATFHLKMMNMDNVDEDYPLIQMLNLSDEKDPNDILKYVNLNAENVKKDGPVNITVQGLDSGTVSLNVQIGKHNAMTVVTVK